MGWRKITVGGREYRWRYGHSFVIVRDENMKTIVRMPTHEMAGMTPWEWERACWKKYGSIKPDYVAQAIRQTTQQLNGGAECSYT